MVGISAGFVSYISLQTSEKMCREGDRKKCIQDLWKKYSTCSAKSRAPKHKISTIKY